MSSSARTSVVSMALVTALVTAIATAIATAPATGCDSSGGERGLYQPDMTWGPASNGLYLAEDYTTDEDWVERYCEHVHVTCQEDPSYYEYCLMDWGYYQQVCPEEVPALLSCIDALYDCGDQQSWEWWDLVTAVCASEIYRYDLCIEPYTRWD